MQYSLSNLVKKQIEIVLTNNKDLFSGDDLREQLYLADIEIDIPSEGHIQGYGDLYYKGSAIKYIFSHLNDDQIVNYVSKLYLNVVAGTYSRVSFLNQLNEVLKKASIQLDKDGNVKFKSVNNKSVFTKKMQKTQKSSIFSIDTPKGTVQSKQADSKEEKKVFIVHGHDNEMKANVARVIEKLGLDPIILHEQPNMGRTIIEKFQSHSQNVSFAIILISPDDKGCKSDLFPKAVKYRARQNVILELGYFIGTLGREKVFVLAKTPEELEIPSDILAVLYTPYKNGWEKELVKEMKACNIDVDMNKLV